MKNRKRYLPTEHSHPVNRAPFGKGYVPANNWPDDMVEFLKAEVLRGHSNGVISRAINEQTGPGQRWAKLHKSASAVGGKIDRLEISDQRPINRGRPPKERRAKVTKRQSRCKPAAPDNRMKAAALLKDLQASKADDARLRPEDDHAAGPASPVARNPGGSALVHGRPPSFPDIVEASDQAIGVRDAGDAVCMWPASDDIKDMKVCGAPATIGAYCDHHATKAYRVMPTAKRNNSYRKDDDEWKRGVYDAADGEK